MIEAASSKRFAGKFKGTVVENVDPLQQGRLKVRVPDVLGADACIWAHSASPLAGRGMGMYFIPPNDSGVWIEFEQGDPDSAVWTGCWRGSSSDVPSDGTAAPARNPPIVIQSETNNKIIVSSESGKAIRLETGSANGPFIEITQDSIKLGSGSGAVIEIKGNKVSINDPALVVE